MVTQRTKRERGSDITGKTYGFLEVKTMEYDTSGHRPMWIAICKCNRCRRDNVRIIPAELKRKKKNGHIPQTSCGCWKPRKSGEDHPYYKGFKDIRGKYWNRYIKQASNRNIQFSISIQYVWSLYEKQERYCSLSGLPIVFASEGKTTASIDRIDNSQGYVEGNIQILHKDVNIMKKDMLQSAFIDLCKHIADRS